jgi:hypothetical protein
MLLAQQATAPQAAPQPTASQPPAAPEKPLFKPEELEQIVAPIALYPDSLLAQVFMASTYPLAIVEAARWQKANPDVKGDAVAKAVENQDWDASVKSLVAFPQVLTMMDEKIDWTQKLGDAFLAQQKDVMDAVQRLRAKAKKEGNLESSKEQVVKTEPAPAGSANPQIIIIESADPEVVYVPTYNPTVVYGAWAYPAYPPYYYYPPYYGGAFFSFSMGVIVGGALWGNCNWGGSDIDIDINRENNFNRNEINHNRDGNRAGNTDRAGNRAGTSDRANSKWQHNPSNRKGVEYRDANSRQKYGGASSREAVQARDSYRGRAEQGRQQIQREGAGNQRDMAGNRLDSGSRDAAGNRAGQTRDAGAGSSRDFGGSGQSRDRGAGAGQSRDFGSSSGRSRSPDAFSGVGSGASTRASSSRGAASRGSGGMSRGGGGRRR